MHIFSRKSTVSHLPNLILVNVDALKVTAIIALNAHSVYVMDVKWIANAISCGPILNMAA